MTDATVEILGPRPTPDGTTAGDPRPFLGPLVVIPGSDLAGPFYRTFGEALVEQGFEARLLSLPECDRWSAVAGAVHPHLERLETPATLAGHSLGGLIALLAAARAPEKIRALVLLEPAIVPRLGLARRAADRYVRDVVFGDRTTFHNWSGSFKRVHQLENFPTHAIEHYLENRRRGDPHRTAALFADLPSVYPLPFDRITAPVLILRGASSGTASLVGAIWLRHALPKARIEVISGAGHWLANERDTVLAEVIARFVGAEARS